MKVMHVMFFSRNRIVFDSSVPVCMEVSDHCYCALLQENVGPAFRLKQLELSEHGHVFPQDNETHHRFLVRNDWCNIGDERC